MKYNCIIFDCDGVLVDSEHIATRVFVEMVEEFGLELNETEVFEIFAGKAFQDNIDYIEAAIGKKLPQNFESLFRQKTYQLFQSEIKPIEGIPGLLEKIQIPYCVASNGPLDKMVLNLKATQLFDKFEGKMFSAYEIGIWKPDPGLFLFAAEQMGFAPEECLVIEDSQTGFEAAKAGGFDVMIYQGNRRNKQFKEQEATVFYDMTGLVSMLKELN